MPEVTAGTMELAEVAGRVLEGGRIGLEEALFLLRQDPYELAMWGRRITEAHHGKRVDLCSIVSGRSGRCPEDCKFCAQSVFYQTGIETFPLREAGEILAAAEEAKRVGAHRFDIVVAGTDPGGDFERICGMLGAIRERTGLETCASLGSLTPEQARELRAAGVSRYNHNVETARAFFPEIISTHGYDDRLETLRNVREAGMELCCGCIIGLGESVQDRAQMALEIRELEPEVVPLNVLNPIPGTPLEEVEPIAPLDIIRAIAMFRFVMPKAVIKLAGGRERNLRDMQALGVVAGANGLIVGNYLTTAGRAPEEDLRMIADLGLTAS
ncbi:MAG: biotin synthase BioB [Armatimonadota bacterium]